MTALQNKPLPITWFQCTICWKIFSLRIKLATHLKKRHNEGNSIEFSATQKDRAKKYDRAEGEKVTPTQNMTACHASDAFICGFDCNEQFTALQMSSAHCLEAQKSEISKARKTFPNKNELSLQQTIGTTIKEIPVYDISSSDDESTLEANTNCERRAEVEEKVAVTTGESLVNSKTSTVTNLVRQHPPESTFASQSNHPRVLSPLTHKKKQSEVLKSTRLRRGVMLHKRTPRRCPYCPQNFLLIVDMYRHIKGVHGQLLTRISSVANCNESKKTWIETPARATISKSSNPAKSQANDTKPDVGPGSTNSIEGYECQLCLNTFGGLPVFKSHFNVGEGCLHFIPSVFKHQLSEQPSFLSTRSPGEGNILLEVEEEQKPADLTGTSNNWSDSQEMETKTSLREPSVLLERAANKMRADVTSQYMETLGHPRFQVKALKVNRMVKRFLCPSCPKLFGSRRLRDDHFTMHSGQKCYICPVCGTRIRYSQSLNKHMKKFHGLLNYNVDEAVDHNIQVPSTQEGHELFQFFEDIQSYYKVGRRGIAKTSLAVVVCPKSSCCR